MSRSTFRIKEYSSGIIENLKSQIESEKDKKIWVGIQKGKGRKEEKGETPNQQLTNAQIGLYNEFGTETIPERSFIRSTLAENRQKYSSFRQKLIKRILDGKLSIKKGYALLGELASSDIKKKIRDLDYPPNAPSTIAKKKSDNPLIDTGQMRNSINYIIATRKEIES